MKPQRITFQIYGFLLALFTLAVHKSEGGTGARALPGLKCISSYGPGRTACANGNCEFQNPGNVFELGCTDDCVVFHGAKFGFCAPGNICTCGPSQNSPSPSAPKSLHCRDIAHAQEFQTICEEDCKCNHDAIGGGCNFWTKACVCGPRSPKSTFDCPYRSANEYFLNLVRKMGDLGYNVMEFLS